MQTEQESQDEESSEQTPRPPTPRKNSEINEESDEEVRLQTPDKEPPPELKHLTKRETFADLEYFRYSLDASYAKLNNPKWKFRHKRYEEETNLPLLIKPKVRKETKQPPVQFMSLSHICSS